MAGPINFTINYVCSPNAVSGILEYRRLQADGTLTNWIPNLSTGNPFAINTQGGTVLNQTLSNISGNGTDFIYNTTYYFRIKQTCDTGVIEYSNVSDPEHAVNCPQFQFLVDTDYRANTGYALKVRLYDNLGIGYPMNPNLASIVEYVFDIKTDIGGVITSIGSFTVPVTAFTQGAPYFDFLITSDDLSQPIESSTLYYLDVGFCLYDGRSVTCYNPCPAPTTVTTPVCSTYKIYFNEFLVLEYRDCSGVKRTCSDFGTNTNNKYFYLCSQTIPRAYTCINGPVPTKSFSGNFIVPPGQLFVPGQTPFSYDPATGNPLISYGGLVELVSSGGCDPNYNGDLNTVTTNQLGSPWYNYRALNCNPPPCVFP